MLTMVCIYWRLSLLHMVRKCAPPPQRMKCACATSACVCYKQRITRAGIMRADACVWCILSRCFFFNNFPLFSHLAFCVGNTPKRKICMRRSADFEKKRVWWCKGGQDPEQTKDLETRRQTSFSGMEFRTRTSRIKYLCDDPSISKKNVFWGQKGEGSRTDQGPGNKA